MQAGPREHLRDAHLPHGWKKGLQLPHQVAYEVRESVHRLSHPHQRAPTLFVDAPLPRAYRLLVEQEDPCNLLPRPAASRLDFENPQPLDRRVVRPPARRQPAPASVLDPQLLLEERDLGVGAIEF
jgi:hypothetical protein